MQVPHRKGDRRLGQPLDPYLTAAKFAELKEKLTRLKNISRPRAAEEVKRLALDGDFSENAGYQLAKGRLRGVNQRIIDLEKHLHSAVIIRADERSDKVQIGSRVILERAGKQQAYLILGSTESEPGKGVISHRSPLGEALIGHRVSDIIKLNLANKEVECTIIKIEQA
jgi:transcription elongation factor GreA